MFNHVTIIGLGLIGGSMGLALRKAKAAQQVIGYDLGKGVSEHAYKVGAIDQAAGTPADAVRGAELVIIATPVGAVQALLQKIAPALLPGTIVTDVSSTKTQVMRWAEEYLPSSITFVPGHPMTGKEQSGVDAADAALFKDCIYCLTPAERTPAAAVAKISTLIEVFGARAYFLTAAEHDKYVASVSHLPFLASIALVNTVAAAETWRAASLLAAGGFRDVTRLAAGSPEMYRDICLTNSEAIAASLDAYIDTLSQLRDRILQDDRDLNETFAEAQRTRLHWQETYKNE